MAIRTLQFPDQTEDILSEVARMTGVRNEEWIAEVVQDALRTYWLILQEQAKGKVIASLDPQVVHRLSQEGGFRSAAVLKTMVHKDPVREAIPA